MFFLKFIFIRLEIQSVDIYSWAVDAKLEWHLISSSIQLNIPQILEILHIIVTWLVFCNSYIICNQQRLLVIFHLHYTSFSTYWKVVTANRFLQITGNWHIVMVRIHSYINTPSNFQIVI